MHEDQRGEEEEKPPRHNAPLGGIFRGLSETLSPVEAINSTQQKLAGNARCFHMSFCGEPNPPG